jgi:hypothetical protein
MMTVLAWLFLSWIAMLAGPLLYYRRDLLAVWREPVVRYPVLVIESDDWGAGPVERQSAALEHLADLLARHRDETGRRPVVTLALVLAVPDGEAVARDGVYRRRTLVEPAFAPVLEAIRSGHAAGVFALQLHGLEHFWPDSLMAAPDPDVQTWLCAPAPATTEQLPSHLQSRWVDASVLPSRALEPMRVKAAVAEEVRVFEQTLGMRPRVVVPPTFVWTEAVERAWRSEGIAFVVTPGLRSSCRNAAGVPDCDSPPLHNGQMAEGLTYLVRNDYFEPERGHRAERGLAALVHRFEQGRPCLLEMHRSNFIGDIARAQDAITEIERLYSLALKRVPTLRFLSTEELGRAMQDRDPAWIERRLRPRFAAWVSRVRAVPRFWRLARLSGLAWVLGWLRARAVADAPRQEFA